MVQLPELQSVTSSLVPSTVMALGSRSVASLADCIPIPVMTEAPTEGVTIKPASLASLAESKFKYLAWVPSMALATPSDPGLFDEEAITGSPGCATFFGALDPKNCTSPIWKQQLLGPCVW